MISRFNAFTNVDDYLNYNNKLGISIHPSSQLNNGLNNFGYNSTFNNTMMGVQAAGSLANTWLGYQNYRMAKDSYKINKKISLANYENQAKAYNESLQNQTRSRLADSGYSDSAMNSYFDSKEFRNKLVKEHL